MVQALTRSVVVRGQVLLGAVSLAVGLLLAPPCVLAMQAHGTHEPLAERVRASFPHAPLQHGEHGRRCELYAGAGSEFVAPSAPRCHGLQSPRAEDALAGVTSAGTDATFAGAAARWSVPVVSRDSRVLYLVTGRLRL